MQRDNAERDLIVFLAKHIDRIESVRNHILKEYYGTNNDERDGFKGMVDEYFEYLTTFINEDTQTPEQERWPLVLIGSVVEVHNLDYDEIDSIRIVPPFYDGTKNGMDCASCLSPIGRALLLKGIGQKVKVFTPLGSLNLAIKAIKTPNT